MEKMSCAFTEEARPGDQGPGVVNAKAVSGARSRTNAQSAGGTNSGTAEGSRYVWGLLEGP